MMSSRETFLTDWTAAVDAFNRGDIQPYAALMADGATHTTENGTLPRTGAKIATEIYEPARVSSGWAQQILSIASEGEFCTVLYRNHFTDGSSALGCGVIRLDDAGKIVAVYTWEQSDVRTPLSRPGR
jgi:hypothetical protein